MSEKHPVRRKQVYNDLAWEKVLASLQQEHQVMVFMHSRNDTVRTAEFFKQRALLDKVTELLVEPGDPRFGAVLSRAKRVRPRATSVGRSRGL